MISFNSVNAAFQTSQANAKINPLTHLVKKIMCKNYLRGHYYLKKQKGEKERKINAPLI
jgi:hypothetical protein